MEKHKIVWKSFLPTVEDTANGEENVGAIGLEEILDEEGDDTLNNKLCEDEKVVLDEALVKVETEALGKTLEEASSDKLVKTLTEVVTEVLGDILEMLPGIDGERPVVVLTELEMELVCDTLLDVELDNLEEILGEAGDDKLVDTLFEVEGGVLNEPVVL